jgi:hypothetical protein
MGHAVYSAGAGNFGIGTSNVGSVMSMSNNG